MLGKIPEYMGGYQERGYLTTEKWYFAASHRPSLRKKCKLQTILWFLMSIFKWNIDINPVQDGPFRCCSQMGVGVGQKAPLPKICHTYPTMMKLGTVIPYLRKIQKMYKSRDTSLEFCWHQHFFTKNQQFLVYQEIQV